MIEILVAQFNSIIDVLDIFLRTIQIIQRRRLQRQRKYKMMRNIIIILSIYFDMIITWLNMVTMYMKTLKNNRKKQTLFKAHLLLNILAGYRYIFIFIEY